MTPKFLREQATHLRGMADVTDRKTSKLKLMTLAEVYEGLAEAADQSTADEIMVRAGEKIANGLTKGDLRRLGAADLHPRQA